MPRFDSTSTSIVYDDLGEGPAILLMHGFPLDRRVWRDVADVLGQSMRVIVPDLPGFGRSRSSRLFTMPTLADALGELMTSLGISSYAAAGLSMGGYVGLELVSRTPAVSRFVLVDSKSTADDETAKQNRNKMIDLVNAAGTSAVVEQMLPRMFHASVPRDRPRVVARLTRIMLDCPVPTIANACAAMRDRADHTTTVASLGSRLGIIVGEGDMITPLDVARAINASSPGSVLHVIEEAGHMAPLERPDAVAEALLKILGA